MEALPSGDRMHPEASAREECCRVDALPLYWHVPCMVPALVVGGEASSVSADMGEWDG
jgi:hypothetical protein